MKGLNPYLSTIFCMIISLITVGMNHRKYIEALYGSLYTPNNTDTSQIEAIYVDNCSTDDSVNYIRENYPQVKIVQNVESLGFGENNNKGVMASRGDYIGIVNPDIVLKKGSIDSIMNKAKEMNWGG